MKPIFVEDKIVKGFGRGSRELGCPTSNIDNSSQLDIPNGIYCGFAQLVIHNDTQIQYDSSRQQFSDSQNGDAEKQTSITVFPKVFPVYAMVCSYGYNPQYGNTERTLEVHILNEFGFDFYGATLKVLICQKLRDELKFNNFQELKDAIADDKRNGAIEVIKYKHLKKDNSYFQDLNES